VINGGSSTDASISVLCWLRGGTLPDPAASPTTGLAVASMVLGIVSILVWWLWGVVSLILGTLAIGFAARTPCDRYGSRPGTAIAGFGTGILGCAFGCLSPVLTISVAVGGTSGR
jgi:hypothetical protein